MKTLNINQVLIQCKFIQEETKDLALNLCKKHKLNCKFIIIINATKPYIYSRISPQIKDSKEKSKAHHLLGSLLVPT